MRAGAALAPIAGLIGGLTGALLMSVLGDQEARPVEVAGLSEFEQCVEALTDELRVARLAPANALPEVGRTPEGVVEPLHAGPAADLVPLIARIDTLIARWESAGASRTAPLQIPDEASTAAARRELFTADRVTLMGSAQLMTYQQVVERYGRPDAIHIQEYGSVTWHYMDEATNAMVGFTFFDGLVCN